MRKHIKMTIIIAIVGCYVLFLSETKSNWKETLKPYSYSVTFDHFTGKQKIPTDCPKGEFLYFKLINQTRGIPGKPSAIGIQVQGPFGGYRTLEEAFHNGETMSSVYISGKGKHYIIVKGQDIEGTFTVEWLCSSAS